MPCKVNNVQNNGGRSRTYDVTCSGRDLTVEILPYAGPDDVVPQPLWSVDVRFVDADRDIGGDGRTKEEAFDAAARQYATSSERDKLPSVDWNALRTALKQAKAFA